MNEAQKLRKFIAVVTPKFYSHNLSQKTKEGLRARALRMAPACNKKHNHFSRCEGRHQ